MDFYAGEIFNYGFVFLEKKPDIADCFARRRNGK